MSKAQLISFADYSSVGGSNIRYQASPLTMENLKIHLTETGVHETNNPRTVIVPSLKMD